MKARILPAAWRPAGSGTGQAVPAPRCGQAGPGPLRPVPVRITGLTG